MKHRSLAALVSALLTMSFVLSSCGGNSEQAPPEKPVAQVCPVCPPPPPSPEPKKPSINDILSELGQKQSFTPEKLKELALQFNILDHLGEAEVSPENFPHFVSFFWAIDPGFRILQLRAMMSTNRLVDMLKPAKGKFDIQTPPKDPEAEDVSLLISQVIVDWSLVQARILDDFRVVQVTNVKGVKPGEDFPIAETMMQELRALVTPPEATTPEKVLQGAMLLLERPAEAQTSGANAKANLFAPKAHSIAVVRVKTKAAPLLLARVLSYKVGDKTFVLESPFMIVAAEFRAVPVEQFLFKVEKMTVGPAYHDALEIKVNALAEIQQRSIPEWWEMANGMTEMRLVNQLVDYNKVAPPTLPSAPLTPPTSGNPPSAPGSPTTLPSPSAPTAPTTLPSLPPSSGPGTMAPIPPGIPSAGSGLSAPSAPAPQTSTATSPSTVPANPIPPARNDVPMNGPLTAPAPAPQPATEGNPGAVPANPAPPPRSDSGLSAPAPSQGLPSRPDSVSPASPPAPAPLPPMGTQPKL